MLIRHPPHSNGQKKNYYGEYKGHTKWLSLISGHFAKNIFFFFFFWHDTSSCTCSLYLYYVCRVSESFTKSSGTSWFPHVCAILEQDKAKKNIYVCFRFQAEKKLGMVGRNNILFCQNILFSRWCQNCEAVRKTTWDIDSMTNTATQLIDMRCI